MNKAFTKEDESEAPETVPPRPPLPAGTTNYVTARGLAKLKDELQTLDVERAREGATELGAERSRSLARLATRRAALEERLSNAVLVDTAQQAHDEVRFGATVTVQSETHAERTYRIVGVDEADPAQGFVAFVSPLARALLGRRAGEIVVVRTPRGDDEVEILSIAYDDPAPETRGG